MTEKSIMGNNLSKREELSDRHLQANMLFDATRISLGRNPNQEEQTEFINSLDAVGHRLAMRTLIDNTRDPHRKVDIVKINLSFMERPARVAHLISIRAGSLPFGEEFGEAFAIKQYEHSMEDNPSDAHAIAKLMRSSREALVDSTRLESDDEKLERKAAWQERYEKALILHAEAFLQSDPKTSNYGGRLHMLFDEVCMQDTIGEIGSFPQELARELTRKVIEVDIIQNSISRALDNAYDTGMRDDDAVAAMIADIEDQEFVAYYDRTRREKEASQVRKARIGAPRAS